MKPYSLPWKSILVVALSLVFGGRESHSQPVDFAHQIVPILKKHCVECHGGSEAEGSFSVNTRELVIDSGQVVVGEPEQSYLVELIGSEDADVQMPPADRPRVSPEERRLLAAWIAEGAHWDAGFSFVSTVYEPPLQPRRPELPPAVDGREHPIDRILDAGLQNDQQQRPAAIDDAVFLRRVSLDLVGLLPDPETLKRFLADRSPDKREQVIDRLLADEIGYADHWMSFFNDLFRNDYSGTGFITGGRAQISGWLYESLLNNKPFDVLARELIAPPTAASRGYIDGIKWRGEVSAGQSVEIQFAQSISQSFLGINLKCASCHDSFTDRWTLNEAFGLAAIYSERPLEIHRCDKPLGRHAEAAWLFPELGSVDPAAPRDERLQQLAELMTHRDNGRFTRTIVNRLWYKLMGRGIVHPLDAMQTEPWNADLLDHLAVSLSDHDYDLKAILKLIATSQAYQSQSVAQTAEPGQDYVYRGPVTRRMTAEQFLDNVWRITGSAPHQLDAPVIRTARDEDPVEAIELRAQWIWGDSAVRPQVPPAGETILLRKTFRLDEKVRRGGAVMTCDNGFTLYINGREIRRSDDWTEIQAIALHTLLRRGDNEIVVVASNAGNGPNAAGWFFDARLELSDDSIVTVASDASWEFNSHVPEAREGRLGKIAGEWAPVTVVPPVAAWIRVTEGRAAKDLAAVVSGNMPMVRASLIENNFLMKSLGRPLREQIVSMRPAELTTLEAINLSNGPALADALAWGGESLAMREWNDREALVRFVFQSTLCRGPQADELETMVHFLSDPPKPTEVEDLLWSVMMMPEFWLVR